MTKTQYSIRIDSQRLAHLKAAIAKMGPYAPSITQVIEHGIDLALKKLEKTWDRSAAAEAQACTEPQKVEEHQRNALPPLR